MLLSLSLRLIILWRAALACNEPQSFHAKHYDRRAQPGALEANTQPTRDLIWGRLNFIHTTDTHGWLAGHLREANYGADWGDFVSFTQHMRKKAEKLGVDLLILDTGDLHEGAALSDLTPPPNPDGSHTPKGQLSNDIFNSVDYDFLTVGNHDLYGQQFKDRTLDFTKRALQKDGTRGPRKGYLTTNVQYLNEERAAWEYVGESHRHFVTKSGLRIMALGVIFNFRLPSSIRDKTTVLTAWDLVNGPARKYDRARPGSPGSAFFSGATPGQKTQLPRGPHADGTDEQFEAAERAAKEFQAAISRKDVDMFLVLGHNPADLNQHSSTFQTIFDAIRQRDVHRDTPIQFIGGHSHVRDFRVYDNKATAFQSGRYCETLGWLSISGFDAPFVREPQIELTPSEKAVPKSYNLAHASKTPSNLRYSRRYLDWNRRTFSWHARGSQNALGSFDTAKGKLITNDLEQARKRLRVTKLLGCAPRDFYMTGADYLSENSIYSLVRSGLAEAVVPNEKIKDRQSLPRVIINDNWNIRFDILKGPFTIEDCHAASPFDARFNYIPEVPLWFIRKAINSYNRKRKRAQAQKRDKSDSTTGHTHVDTNECLEPPFVYAGNATDPSVLPVARMNAHARRSLSKRAEAPGPYLPTIDDLGGSGDGDDIPITNLRQNHLYDRWMGIEVYIRDGLSEAEQKALKVDVVFEDWNWEHIIKELNDAIGEQVYIQTNKKEFEKYSSDEVATNTYLGMYAKKHWRPEGYNEQNPVCDADPVDEGKPVHEMHPVVVPGLGVVGSNWEW